ncbi:MAG: undecaprenyl-diphosphatase UppP [Vicinamibacterales bacterium]
MLTAALLGVIQGLTEFLPVSSSAHLILARFFFGWEAPEFGLAFDVALHVGTLIAILVYFWSDILAMLRALPSALSANAGPSARLIRLIAIGTVPAIIAGLLFNDSIEAHLRTPLVAAIALTVGAALMLIAERVTSSRRDVAALTMVDAVLIGIAQACALIPGVSRSGSTIAIGMLLGVRRESAARFTFLLAIPAILAAAGKESIELRHMNPDSHVLMLFAVGAGVSAVVGYVTITYFLRFLARHRLDVFAYYRLALAAVTLARLAL